MQVQIEPNTHEIVSADPALDPEQFQEQFCELIKLPESIPVYTAIDQLLGGFIAVKPENQERINFYLAFVAAQQPESLLEAQLIVQLLASHGLCMDMLKKAKNEKWHEALQRYVDTAMKLSRGFKTGLETLSKYRRNGKQFLYIERINVEKEGNAVIGNINGKGGR